MKRTQIVRRIYKTCRENRCVNATLVFSAFCATTVLSFTLDGKKFRLDLGGYNQVARLRAIFSGYRAIRSSHCGVVDLCALFVAQKCSEGSVMSRIFPVRQVLPATMFRPMAEMRAEEAKREAAIQKRQQLQKELAERQEQGLAAAHRWLRMFTPLKLSLPPVPLLDIVPPQGLMYAKNVPVPAG
jgi:hypothetical protein